MFINLFVVRLVVRNSESLEIVHIFSCLDNIQSILTARGVREAEG